MKYRIVKLGVIAAAAAAALFGVDAASAASAVEPSAAVPAQWAELAVSSTPKVVVLDASSGAVLSVTPQSKSAALQAITVHNPCKSGDACWVHNAIPYADYGFAGTGTKNGTWSQRNKMYTHSHSTSFCWTQSPICSPRFGPNSVIGFDHYPVTGTRVTNYS